MLLLDRELRATIVHRGGGIRTPELIDQTRVIQMTPVGFRPDSVNRAAMQRVLKSEEDFMSIDSNWPKKGNRALVSAADGAYFHMP